MTVAALHRCRKHRLQQPEEQQQRTSGSDSGCGSNPLPSALELELADALAHNNNNDKLLLLLSPPTSISLDDALTDKTTDLSGSTSGGSTSSDVERELEAGEDDVGTVAVATAAPPALKRRRKRTYDTRKDEIDALATTAAELGAMLAFLKHRAGVQDAQSVAQTERENAVLREALEIHALHVAGARSMLSTDSSRCALSPISTPIHLSRDLAQRRATLAALKPQKLHDARRFLEKRTQALHPTMRWSESTRLDACRGDRGVVKLDVVPLRRATSVQHAFDAVMFYFAHLEICSTEALGDVTVRQDIDGDVDSESASASAGGSSGSCRPRGSTTATAAISTSTATSSSSNGIAQHRFVRQHRDQRAVVVETNSVVFAEHTPTHRCAQTGECREEAIVVTDFVDRDDRSPYRPRERVRKDITSILHLRRREVPATDAARLATPSGAREQVVVLTMWYHATLRCSESDCGAPPERLDEIMDDTDRVFSATLRSVRNALEVTGAALE